MYRCTRLLIATSLAVAILSAGFSSALLGQVVAVPAGPRIMLPPSYGATPLSTVINANAALTVARGSFLESAANARLTNSQAAKQEIENSVEWVRSYFQRKEINRQYTRKPDYIDTQRKLNKMAKSLIETDYEVELKTDPSDKLNFMLRELIVNAPPDRFYANGTDTLVDSQFDQKLSPTDIHRIRLSDGGRNGLVFRADEEALKTSWPSALRVKSLEVPCFDVTQARNAAVKELLEKGTLSHETAQRLRDRLDTLTAAFIAEYPPERLRTMDPMRDYTDYLAGKRALQAFANGVHHMVTTEDPRSFDGSTQFNGDSVADLIAHMHTLGLKFAPANRAAKGPTKKCLPPCGNSTNSLPTKTQADTARRGPQSRTDAARRGVSLSSPI